MHLLTAFSLKNRALIALVTIVAAVFGVIGVGSLKQELMPSVQFPTIAVVTSYEGAAPEVVNADVTGPIETALRSVPQLESTSSTSSTGASMVLAQFTYGVDLSVTEQKVERAISRIGGILPSTADTQVVSGSIDDFPVIQIAVTPGKDQTANEAAALVSTLVTPKLSDIDGVREAQLSGARTEQVVIRPDVTALAAAGLSAQSLIDALQQSGVLIAGGTVTDGDRTLAVQVGSTVTSAEEIAALPIPGTPAPVAVPEEAAETNTLVDGELLPEEPAAPAAPLTVGAFATVETEQTAESSISRVDGKPALSIGVTKVSTANTVEVSHAVQAEIEALTDQLDGAQMDVIFDQAPYIEESVETLTTEGLLGLLFAVLVILVFLMSVRATLVTAISIPVSVLLTFIGLSFADYTLNLLTLGALTISIGRVVDDSIVVIENIKRHLVHADSDTDESRMTIIVRAVKEVAGAITASTVTTVAVFLPMAFVSGMVGELFRPFAFTVTIALVASLLVSLTIVPVLALWFLRSKPMEAGTGKTSRIRSIDVGGALERRYRPIIEWTLGRPLATLVAAVVILGGTLAATPLMKTNFLGVDGQNSVGLVQTLAPGTSLEAQLTQAERVEEALDGISGVESVQVTIGTGGSGASAMLGGTGDGVVNYSVNTVSGQSEVIDQIRDAVDVLEDAGDFAVSESGGAMPGMSSSIAVSVAAPNADTLAEASESVLIALQSQPELRQVESDLGQSRPYLSVTVDRVLAAQAGLSEAAVARQMAGQMQPQQIGQITRDASVTSVYIVTNAIPTDQAGVAALPIQTPQGVTRLDALATVGVADGPVAIHTADGARTVTVSALPVGDDLSSASAAVTAALDSIELPAGATAEIGGVMSQQSEAFEQLGIALLAAILIVYVVMVATFRSLLQPLLLLASVPFAATGALLLLLITGIPLGVPSLIGVLMLIGVVVTNAIVLVDLVNQYRERGDALRDAVLNGTLQRLRPIVMTALATILALTPMALGITGQGGFISQPLAVVVIGGLLSSTVLTLIVLPTLYYVVERLRDNDSGGGPKRPGSPTPPVVPRRSPAVSEEPAAHGPRRSRAGVGSGFADATAVAAGTVAAGTVATDTAAGLAGAGAGAVTAGAGSAVATAGVGIDAGAEAAAAAAAYAAFVRSTEAPETAAPRAAGRPAPSAQKPAVSPEPATSVEPETVAPVVLPEPVDTYRPVAAPFVPGVAGQGGTGVPTVTAEMSLALENLGFVGEQNPLAGRGTAPTAETMPLLRPAAEQTKPRYPDTPVTPTSEASFASDVWDPAATNDLAPLVLPVPGESDPAPIAEQFEKNAAPEAVMDVTPSVAVRETPTAPLLAVSAEVVEETTGTIDPVAPLHPLAVVPDNAIPAAVAPPVTGELNWEQLMWEATQEQSPQATESEMEAGASDATVTEESVPKTYPAEQSDRADDTGQAPGEEQ